MIRVVCWLWKDDNYRFNSLFRYGAKHVNTLHSMVRRHLDLDHEFVCITDDPTGINPDVRIVPMWSDCRKLGGCYARLKAFSPEMKEIIGPRFVWIDLDCVVTGDLTPLFEREEDFVIWRNGVGRAPYCGSMVMMTSGARKEVWEDFDPEASPRLTKDFVGTDQAWIAYRLGLNEAVWTQEDGVCSRYHAGIRNPGEKPALTAVLPENARLVFFHGPCDPSQERLQEKHSWIRENWR